jgi:hypothetical protein
MPDRARRAASWSRFMDNFNRQSRKLEQLLSELAELRARVTEQCRQAAEEREEAWTAHVAARQRAVQLRGRAAAGRRQRQERAGAEEQDGGPIQR